jgi:hypothetical protein
MKSILSGALAGVRLGRADWSARGLPIEFIELSLADFGRAIAFMGIESTF